MKMKPRESPLLRFGGHEPATRTTHVFERRSTDPRMETPDLPTPSFGYRSNTLVRILSHAGRDDRAVGFWGLYWKVGS
jgi:hypothetical protein